VGQNLRNRAQGDPGFLDREASPQPGLEVSVKGSPILIRTGPNRPNRAEQAANEGSALLPNRPREGSGPVQQQQQQQRYQGGLRSLSLPWRCYPGGRAQAGVPPPASQPPSGL